MLRGPRVAGLSRAAADIVGKLLMPRHDWRVRRQNCRPWRVFFSPSRLSRQDDGRKQPSDRKDRVRTKKLAGDTLQRERLFFFCVPVTARFGSQWTEEETVPALGLLRDPSPRKKKNFWNVPPVITTQKSNSVLLFEPSGRLCLRETRRLCFRCGLLMWEELTDAASLSRVVTARRGRGWSVFRHVVLLS